MRRELLKYEFPAVYRDCHDKAVATVKQDHALVDEAASHELYMKYRCVEMDKALSLVMRDSKKALLPRLLLITSPPWGKLPAVHDVALSENEIEVSEVMILELILVTYES